MPVVSYAPRPKLRAGIVLSLVIINLRLGSLNSRRCCQLGFSWQRRVAAAAVMSSAGRRINRKQEKKVPAGFATGVSHLYGIFGGQRVR